MSRAGTTFTGWVGWVWFAGIMLITIGLFDIFQGIVALINDDFAVLVEDGVLVVDLTTWGWVHIIIGAVLVLAGAGVLSGSVWGRSLGVIVAILNALAQLTIMPAYPIWALIIIALDVIVIYALVVHGREAAAV
jgi:hypothetical protein